MTAEVKAPEGTEDRKEVKKSVEEDMMVLSVLVQSPHRTEVRKAIDKLKLNGVNCVCFKITKPDSTSWSDKLKEDGKEHIDVKGSQNGTSGKADEKKDDNSPCVHNTMISNDVTDSVTPCQKYSQQNLLLTTSNGGCVSQSPLPLSTQVSLSLNKHKRNKKQNARKSTRNGKGLKQLSLLSYLNLKKSVLPRKCVVKKQEEEEKPVCFHGEWMKDRVYICNVCGGVEKSFMDMVNHKGEHHPGVIATHTDLDGSISMEPIPSELRLLRKAKSQDDLEVETLSKCSKCSTRFGKSTNRRHSHIIRCGSVNLLSKPPRKSTSLKVTRSRYRSTGRKRRRRSKRSAGDTVSKAVSVIQPINDNLNSEQAPKAELIEDVDVKSETEDSCSLVSTLKVSIPLWKISRSHS